ncbi:hypothetical protein D3C80_1893690 [compost metagenome]
MASPVSASVMLRVPPALSLPAWSTSASSVTAALSVPPITAASLTPVMVTLIWCSVPSRALTVKVSTLVSPAWRYCTSALATL